MATIGPLDLPVLSANQAQKHVTHNEAIRMLSALVFLAVIDRDLDTPPGSPTEGAVYIPAATATGAWTGKEGKILAYQDGAWQTYTPKEGWLAYIKDEDVSILYNGSSWVSFPNNIQSIALLGVNATADATNRISANTPAVLFNRETDDIQVKLNKEAAGDDAAFLFQTNFSVRALIGTLGDDNFHFKVSPDGGSFYEAFIVDKDTGNTGFQKFVGFGAAEALTIDSGAVTATKSYITVDTESASASDDLDTINGGTEGDIIVVRATDSAHTVVMKDGTGNMKLNGDFSLNNNEDRITLMRDSANWVELCRSDNGA